MTVAVAVTVCVAASLFLTGVGVAAYQAFAWAKFGIWASITVGSALEWVGAPYPAVSWVGVQHILDWWVGSSLAGNLIVAGLVLPVLALGAADKLTPPPGTGRRASPV